MIGAKFNEMKVMTMHYMIMGCFFCVCKQGYWDLPVLLCSNISSNIEREAVLLKRAAIQLMYLRVTFITGI